jgi:hypothetical protein
MCVNLPSAANDLQKGRRPRGLDARPGRLRQALQRASVSAEDEAPGAELPEETQRSPPRAEE